MRLKWKNYDRNHYFLLIILMLLLYLNFRIGNDYLSLLVTLMASFYIVLAKKEHVVPSMVFFSFFSYLFVFQRFSLYVFLCLAFIFRCFLKNNRNIQTILLLFPFYILTHIMALNFTGFSIGSLIPFFALICFPLASAWLDKTNSNIIYDHYLTGFFLSSVLGFFRSHTRLNEILGDAFISVSSWRDTYRFSGL